MTTFSSSFDIPVVSLSQNIPHNDRFKLRDEWKKQTIKFKSIEEHLSPQKKFSTLGE